MERAVSNLLASIDTRHLICLLALAIACNPAVLQARTCESLLELAAPMASITVAKTVETVAFTPTASSETLRGLPSFCRVILKLSPSADSDIGVEIWLPTSGWNGKFRAVGSGGWGGAINYDALADGLRRGYAASATDD